MERSVAVRLPIGLLARLPAPAPPRRALGIAAIALACFALLGGGWLWLRGSSLVAVRHVHISGVHGPGSSAIDAALTSAARGMSTLEVHVGALQAAVASFPIVREVRASAELPHGLRIRVIEQPPVAVLRSDGERTAVAADGVVLGPRLASASLPTLTGRRSLVPGEHLRRPSLLAELTVLGAVPGALSRLVSHAFSGPDGLTVAMRSGLQAYFGNASRPHAKWLALARVLADPSSSGAYYVDVRLPERPAAGFAPGTAPQGTETAATAAAEAATREGSAAALTAGLAAALGSGVSPSSQTALGGTEGSGGASGAVSQAAPDGGEAPSAQSGPASDGTPGGEAALGAAAPAPASAPTASTSESTGP